MMTFTGLASAPSHPPAPFTDPLRWLAVAACLARFKGSSRKHTESDRYAYLCMKLNNHSRYLDLADDRRETFLPF